MSIERRGLSGPQAALRLERGLKVVEQLPDHTVSQISVGGDILGLTIAPYAVEPSAMRVGLMCLIDGTPMQGVPGEKGWGLRNLRLSSNTSFPDGLQAQVLDAPYPRNPYNTTLEPFSPDTAQMVRGIGAMLGSLEIEAVSLDVLFGDPRTDQAGRIGTSIVGRFARVDDRERLEAGLAGLDITHQFDDLPGEMHVGASHYRGTLGVDSLPIGISMYHHFGMPEEPLALPAGPTS